MNHFVALWYGSSLSLFNGAERCAAIGRLKSSCPASCHHTGRGKGGEVKILAIVGVFFLQIRPIRKFVDFKNSGNFRHLSDFSKFQK